MVIDDDEVDGKPSAKDAYIDWNRQFSATYKQNIKLLDTHLLVLPGALLGISLAVMNNLVDLHTASIVPVLIVGWISLSISVLATLFGLRFSTKDGTIKDAMDAAKQRAGLPPYEKPNRDEFLRRSSKRNSVTNFYNGTAFWAFVVGMTSILLFVCVNVLLAALH